MQRNPPHGSMNLMNERAFSGRTLTQEETQTLNQELERRIAERTRELAEANRNLEQEIARHLETEQELLESNARLKLAETAARAQAIRIENHRKVLLELAQLDEPDFESALEQILKADGEALDVERVSYWSLGGAPLKSEREMLYLKSRGGVARDETLISFDAAHYPRYFEALRSERPIVAHRAQTDPASSEFAEGYLKPHGITSMLDIAVWSQGEIVGVLCHSHVGAPRDWNAEEVKFATAIANMVALAQATTRRRELTRALIESEEKYRLVVEHAGEGIFVTQDGLIRFANPRCVEFFGDAAALSRPLEEFIHHEDRARVLGNYARRVRGEVVENGYVFRTLDSRSLQINAVAIEWEGRPATLSFVSDVSERVRLHEDLARTLNEREVVLETSVAGLVFVQNGRINWINAVFEQEMLGYAKGELVGQRGEFVFPSHESFKTFLSAAVPVIEQGSTFEIEVELKRKNGSLFWGLFSGRAIDSADLSKGSIWYLIDVTERRNMREDLQKTLIEREAILQSTLVGITFSIGRRHIWVNQKFADMLGYQAQELIGQLSAMHFPSRQSFEEFGSIAYPILEQGRPYSTEWQMKRKDGELICCQLYGTCIVAGKPEKGSIWTFVDITELKRALDKEKELSALKSRFVSMTSHEFRTPLATILSATELVENYGERLPAAEKSELIALIKGAVKHMTHMLEQVLLIGKADAGRLDFNPQRLDLKAFCRKVVGELAQSDSGQHRLLFNHEGLLDRHMFDERLMRHMLTNLIGNALKYSSARTEVRLGVTYANEEIKIEVSDQGIGIAPEDQPNLFHSFQRGRNVSNISGTGLGLAIVKKAVSLHGGTIGFKSELDRGTIFTVTLPETSEL